MLTVNPQNRDITIHRFTDEPLKFTIRDSAGSLLNVAAAVFKFTVRDVFDGTVIFQLASPSGGIDMASAASGVVLVNIPRAFTAAMSGRYVYDLQMLLASKITLPAGTGKFTVLKDITGTGAAPVIIPPLQFLTYLTFDFIDQLADGDILTQDFNLARTSTITIRHVHIDADIGPSGGAATFALQDHPTAPTQVINTIVPNSLGAAIHQEFDVDAAPATLTPFILAQSSGKKLTIKVPTARNIEHGRFILGFSYA